MPPNIRLPPCSGPYQGLAFSPPAKGPLRQRYRQTAQECSFPTRLSQVTAGPADTSAAPGGWLHPRSALLVRPRGAGQERARPTGRPRPSNDQLAPHHPLLGRWHSRGGLLNQVASFRPRHPDIRPTPPGSPSPPPGGHPLTGDRKRGGTKRRGPAGLRRPALENPE